MAPRPFLIVLSFVAFSGCLGYPMIEEGTPDSTPTPVEQSPLPTEIELSPTPTDSSPSQSEAPSPPDSSPEVSPPPESPTPDIHTPTPVEPTPTPFVPTPTPSSLDEDGDGYSPRDGDCDDSEPAVHPGATEVCNLIDDNCDGQIDEGLSTIYYRDEDGDSYGLEDDSKALCEAEAPYDVTRAGDCDDGNEAINPDSVETCDGADNDCDSGIDEDFDLDGDGYASCGGDCDDSRSSTHPNAQESCNAVDDNCNGEIDEGFDSDTDGYTTCAGDCDDGSSSIHPDATEQCNKVDDNCNGKVDEGLDADHDGYTPCGGDCDDSEPTVYPGANDPCDGIDQDCDGSSEVPDKDQDGYANKSCGGEDCDDDDAAVHPGAEEVCFDGVDNNCDGDGCTYSGTISLSESAAKIMGESTETWAGRAVANAGDVNGDGYDDILIGARFEDSGGEDAGAAYLVLGPVSGTLDLSEAEAKFSGEATNDHAADAVAGAGDVNADGYDDILIGAPEHDGVGVDSGASYLFYGPVSGTFSLANADAKFYGEYEEDELGYSLSTAGDVNGDGYDDILLGAPMAPIPEVEGGANAGIVYLIHGPVEGTVDLVEAPNKLIGEATRAFAGRSVGSGDFNGDGYGDILIGASGEAVVGNNAGAAYILYGPVEGQLMLSEADVKLNGEVASDLAGWAVASAGDVNADGYDDVLVGAYGDDTAASSAGAAYLLQGPLNGEASLSTATAKMLGENGSDYVGRAVAGVGDVNMDGYADFLIGAYRDDSVGTNSGAAYLIFGPVAGTFSLSESHAKFVGEIDFASAGYAVAGGGDVNGDHQADMLIGAYGDTEGGQDSGATYLLLGGGL